MLDALVRDGLLVGRLHHGELRFTAADVAIVAGGLRVLETGLPLPELLALARRQNAAMRRFATEAVELFDTYVRQPLRTADLSEPERAERMVNAFRVLLPAVTELAGYHLRRDAGGSPHLRPAGARRRVAPACARRPARRHRVRVRPAQLREPGPVLRRLRPGVATGWAHGAAGGIAAGQPRHAVRPLDVLR